MYVSSNIRHSQSKSIWCHVWSKLVGSKWKAYECKCNAHRNSKLFHEYHPIDCRLSPQTNSYSNNQALESCREVAVARARASQTTRTFGRQISSQPKQRPHTAPMQLVLSGCIESRPPSVRWGSTSGGAGVMRGTLQPHPRALRPTTDLAGARAQHVRLVTGTALDPEKVLQCFASNQIRKHRCVCRSLPVPILFTGTESVGGVGFEVGL